MRDLVLGAIGDIILARDPGRTAAIDRRRQIAAAIAQAWICGEPGAPVAFEDACWFGFGMDSGLLRAKISKLVRRPHGLGSGKRVLGGYGV